MAVSTTGPSPLERLLHMLAAERGELGVVAVYATLAAILSLTLPLGVQAIIGLISGGLLLQPVVLLVAFVVVGTLAAGGLEVLQLAAVERVQQRIFARLALRWSEHIPRVRGEQLGGEDLTELSNRFFEIVTIQKGLAKLFTEAVAATLAILAGVVLLTLYHPLFGFAGFLTLVFLAVTLWMAGRTGLASSLAESSFKYRVAHWLQELARRSTTMQLAGSTPLAVGRMDDEVSNYLVARQAHFRVLVRQSLVAVLFKTLITGGLLVLGTYFVVNRSLTLGQFVASELVVVGLLAGVQKLIASLSTIYDVITAAAKAGRVDDLETLAPSGHLPLPPRPPGGRTLVVRDLRFRYPKASAPTLDGISLDVRPGEIVAVAGSEGSGESTLLRVLAGLYTDYEGSVTIDGVSLRDVDPAVLRREVALVQSIPEIIDGTIEENVAMGREHVSATDVQWALAFAGLAEYVQRLPQGVRTRVGFGVALPEHVERKVALARAVAGRPSLILLDEFFHHHEPGVRRTLVARLQEPGHDWSVLAASHDATYLGSCLRIYLLEHGRVLRQGTLVDLLNESSFSSLLQDGGTGALRLRPPLESSSPVAQA